MQPTRKFAVASPNFSRPFKSPPFEPRFKNWLRWCHEHIGEPHGSASSVEGAYRSPQIWDVVEPNLGLLNPVDKWDAQVVQRAYVVLPDLDRRTIKFMYFRPHWRQAWIAQKLNVSKLELQDRLHASKQKMAENLDALDKNDYCLRTVTRPRPLMEAV